MPTFSRSLEQALHRALSIASEKNHEYATLEHLLLSLIEDKDAVAVMRVLVESLSHAAAMMRDTSSSPSFPPARARPGRSTARTAPVVTYLCA